MEAHSPSAQQDAVQSAQEAGGVIPSVLAAGMLGVERTKTAWRVVQDAYLENPIELEERVAILCAALERPGNGANSVHSTGLSLLGQSDELIDLGAVWDRMAESAHGRRLLVTTMMLGQGKPVPQALLSDVSDSLGELAGAWFDILLFASWADAAHRLQAPLHSASSDARLDAWLGIVVQSRKHLPTSLR